jgi:hypothetical protein
MSSCVELKTKLVDMENFEEFMAEMLEEYNYDKDAVMVTTAFAQALANEWGKQLLIQSVSQQRELLFATLNLAEELPMGMTKKERYKIVDDLIVNNCG